MKETKNAQTKRQTRTKRKPSTSKNDVRQGVQRSTKTRTTAAKAKPGRVSTSPRVKRPRTTASVPFAQEVAVDLDYVPWFDQEIDKDVDASVWPLVALFLAAVSLIFFLIVGIFTSAAAVVRWF